MPLNMTSLIELSSEASDFNWIDEQFKARKLLQLDVIELMEHVETHRRDKFAESLKHVNRLYNHAFGYTPRRVIAHMPHMINKNIMEQLQVDFDFVESSSSRFRFNRDMQFAFSYFYYVREVRRKVTLNELFSSIDMDFSGAWGDREIRLFLSKIHSPPVLLEDLTHFEESAKRCGQPAPVDNREHYFDVEMPLVTLQLIEQCPELSDLLLSWHPNGQLEHKSILMDDEDVDFVMLDGNVSHVIAKLDRVRHNEKKFICINDNIDTKSDYSTIRSLLIDFYLTYLPLPAPHELPNDYRNRFSYVRDFKRWRRHQQLLLYLCISIILLLLLTLKLPNPTRFLRRQLSRL